MTLEEEILKAIESVPLIRDSDGILSDNYGEYAKAAFLLARERIEKALDAGLYQRYIELCGTVSYDELKVEWLKENT